MDRQTLEKQYELWLIESEKTLNLPEPFLKLDRGNSEISSLEKMIDDIRRNTVRKRYGKIVSSCQYMPLVSVIMPTYNRKDFIAESVGSVLNQTFRDFSILVINDGGNDDVEDILRNFHDERIEYFKIPHKGLSGALNTGLRASGSKYISYLDDDDFYYPDHLETLVTCLEKENLEVAYSDTYCVRQEKRDGVYVTTSKEIYSRDVVPSMFLVRNHILAPLALMHRRDCLKITGYFNEKLPVVMDWELWAHMAQNFKFTHVKHITGEYRVRTDKTNMSSGRLKMKIYSDMVRKYLMDKYILNKLDDFMKSGHYAETAELLRVYLGEYPYHVKIHFIQALCHFRTGNFYSAFKSCNRGVNYFIQPFLDEINYSGQELLGYFRRRT